jgi:sugar phosphate permease
MRQKKEIFWGWFIVTGAFLVLGINYGARYCFGVFLKPMAEEFAWSRSVISMAATINIILYSVSAIFVGRMLDRIAPRWIMTAGAISAACGYILTGFVQTPLGFYITYGLMVGLGTTGLGVVTCSSSVGKWFVRKRGLAIGITSMGISFGTITLTPLAGYIVNFLNWRMGLMALGAITLFIGLTVSQTLMRKTQPEAYGLLPDGDKIPTSQQIQTEQTVYKVPARIIFKDSRFWTLAVCQGLAFMVAMSVFVHQVAYAEDNGISKVAAAASLAAISLTGFMGQFFWGWLSDRLKDPKYAFCLGTLFMLAGMILLINANGINELYFYALIYGFGYGSLAPTIPIMAAHRFGRQVLGSIYGLLTFFIGAGGSIGPILGGLIYDHSGSYRYLWLINVFVLIVITLAILTLKKGKQYDDPITSTLQISSVD